MIEFGKTKSCTGRGEFEDAYGQRCMIQPSSSAETARIHLGAFDKGPHLSELGTMHLDRSMVAALLPHLQAFVNTGDMNDVTEEAVAGVGRAEAREALSEALAQAASNLEYEGWKGLAKALQELADPTPKKRRKPAAAQSNSGGSADA